MAHILVYAQRTPQGIHPASAAALCLARDIASDRGATITAVCPGDAGRADQFVIGAVSRYGADLLQQAINYGYGEGLRAGRADREDSWRYNYRDTYAYQDANYGYNGYYVGQGEYNYYFRQGFQRGYEDGYYSRRRFGRTYNGNDILLGTVLSIVLNLQPYHR